MLLKISFVTKLSLFFTYIPPVLKVLVIKKNAQGCFDLKSFVAQKKERKVSENGYNRLSWNFTTRRKTYCFVWFFFLKGNFVVHEREWQKTENRNASETTCSIQKLLKNKNFQAIFFYIRKVLYLLNFLANSQLLFIYIVFVDIWISSLATEIDGYFAGWLYCKTFDKDCNIVIVASKRG